MTSRFHEHWGKHLLAYHFDDQPVRKCRVNIIACHGCPVKKLKSVNFTVETT